MVASNKGDRMHNQLTYTIDEASKVIGLGRTRLYEELNSGRLKGVRAGRRTLIPHASIEDWLNELDAYLADSNQ